MRLSVVTGAFSYTGKYIARRLLESEEQVKTLTGHPDRTSPFGQKTEAVPINFDSPARMAQSLEGADVVYNTYWIRFPKGELMHDRAVKNTETLIEAARDAGVRRFVQVSVTNASVDSPLPYFRGKALVEQAVTSSGLSYAIVRPTVIFGIEDVLVNNIAWFLRRFPVFTMFGPGDYRIQPIYVEDIARLTVDAGRSRDNTAFDAVGPEIFSFEDMVRLIGETIGKKRRIVHIPSGLALFLSKLVGIAVRDVTLTRDEIDGLMANLLVSNDPPTGQTHLGDWMEQNAAKLGTGYASELDRHYR